MNERSALSLIGIAQKAGKVAGGEFAAETSVRSGEAKLLLLAGDASDNTKKKFRNKTAWYQVPLREFGTRRELGQATGRGERAVLAILDEGLAAAIREHLTDE